MSRRSTDALTRARRRGASCVSGGASGYLWERNFGACAAFAAIVMSLAACNRGTDGAKQPASTRKVVPVDSSVGRAPDGVRIKIEVLNATHTRGLGRRATIYLRARGFDVVDIGNSARTQDSTVVLDRSNHPAWAKLIADALRARVIERPDTSRYLDATVLIGADWTPASESFYP